MTNAHFTRFDQYRDIESLNHVAQARTLASATDEQLLAGLAAMSRDNARTPVQWDDSEHAGFTTGRPWLDVNPNHREVNAAAEHADPDSVFHHHRRLIELRHADPVVALGDFTMLLPDDEQVYAFTRSLDGDTLLVVVNVSGEERAVDLGDAWPADGGDDADRGWGELVLGTHPADGARPGVLRPWEAVVVRRR
jgi:oligo-1,6-glucosidase